MMEQGLAQQMADQQTPRPQGVGNVRGMKGPEKGMPKGRMPKNPTPAPTGVNDVVQMLLQGADPDELVERGVPMDMVQQAIEVILVEEESTSQESEPQTEMGLAAMMGEEPKPRGM